MPYLLLDAAVLLVLIFFLWRGASRGFILTLFSLLALLVAFAGANFLADTLSPRVGEALEPKFAAVIQERLEEEFKTADVPVLPGETAPDYPFQGILGMLKTMGLYEDLVNAVDRAVHAGMTEVAAAAAAAVAASIAQAVARAVLFLVFFVLILVGWTLLSHALDLVSKLPGLNTLNRTAGGLVGLVQGALLLFMVGWVLNAWSGPLPSGAAEETVLLRFFMNASPLSLLSGLPYPTE